MTVEDRRRREDLVESDDTANPPRDRTQTDADTRRTGVSDRRPPAPGEEPLEEIRPDDERTSPDRPERPQESIPRRERPRSY